MFTHIVSEVFQQCNFFREWIWKGFEGVKVFCTISLYILYITEKHTTHEQQTILLKNKSFQEIKSCKNKKAFWVLQQTGIYYHLNIADCEITALGPVL